MVDDELNIPEPLPDAPIAPLDEAPGRTLKIKLTRAGGDDVSRIMKLLKKAHIEEPDIRFPEVIDNHLAMWVVNTVANGYVCRAMTSEGRLVGTIGFTATPWPWNTFQRFLNNDWFYVLPEYRQFGVAAELVKEAIKFAKEYKLDLCIGMMMGRESLKKGRFLSTLGLQEAGGFYLMPYVKPEESINDQPIPSENKDN